MGELAAPHRITLPAMTKHVGVLVEAGLVTRRKVGRTVVCTLRPDAFTEVQAGSATSRRTGTALSTGWKNCCEEWG